jgi:hypothetical protein
MNHASQFKRSDAARQSENVIPFTQHRGSASLEFTGYPPVQQRVDARRAPAEYQEYRWARSGGIASRMARAGHAR